MTIRETDELRNYIDRLKRRIEDVLRSDGQLSLCELISRCEGAFPGDVLNAIGELGDAKLVGVNSVLNNGPNRVLSPESDILPEPHPADFDWRFSGATREYLTSVVSASVSESSKILLLCVPTLLDALRQKGRQAVLIDHNQATIRSLIGAGHLGAIFGDIFDADLPLEEEQFDVCIIDPPWYPEHYRNSLFHAARALRTGAVAWMSLLPSLTRPTAIADRRAVIQEAVLLGFDVISLERSRLSYETPPFEMATLRALSISCGSWRKGDLLGLKKVCNVSPERTSEIPVEKWRTFLVNRIQIKLRSKEGRFRGFSAQPIAGSETLLSVSRRFPYRHLIDVWNSRNLAFSVSNTEPLEIALDAIENRKTLQDAICQAVSKSSLDAVEAQELTHMLTQLTMGS